MLSDVIRSLSKENINWFMNLLDGTPISEIFDNRSADFFKTVIQNFSVDHKAAEKAQEDMDALQKLSDELNISLPELLEHSKITPQQINILRGAFNSSSAYTGTFQHTAFAAVALTLFKADAAFDRIGEASEHLRKEITIMNLAKVQGWGTDGFGSHVYRFAKSEIVKAKRLRKALKDQPHHFFYVWHPDNDWHPRFEECYKKKRLSKSFGGYHHDLGTLCNRMRADRETLISNTPYGREAVFHLQIPAYEPIVIDDPLSFHEGLFPLVITGQRHRDQDLVWFKVLNKPDDTELKLEFIGELDSKSEKSVLKKPGSQNPVSKLLLRLAAAFSLTGCATPGTMFPALALMAVPLTVSSMILESVLSVFPTRSKGEPKRLGYSVLRYPGPPRPQIRWRRWMLRSNVFNRPRLTSSD